MTGHNNLSVRLVTSLEEFKTLGPSWNSLLSWANMDNIFLCWEWLYTWATHYLGQNRLSILLVYRDDGELVGIAPFYIRRTKKDGGIYLSDMQFLGTGEVCSSYLDFIVTEKQKFAVLNRIYRYLHEDAVAHWDTLTLAEIPAESSTIDIWDSYVQGPGRVIEVTGTKACPVIHLPGSEKELLGRISSNERYNLQRKRKRLAGSGSVSFDTATSTQDIDKAMDTFINLHQLRWVQKGSGGAFQSSQFLGFHRDVSRVFSERGWVRLDFLVLNGEAIAGIYGFRHEGRYYYYLPGFNPDAVPQASPGMLLLFHCICEAIEAGSKEFDLLQGLTDYKFVWANRIRRSLTLRYYNNHIRSAAYKLIEGGKSAVKILVR